MDLLSELQHAEFKEAFDEFDKVFHTFLCFLITPKFQDEI